MVFALLTCLRLASVANSWPATQYRFTTAEPFFDQVVMFGLGSLVGALMVSAVVALAVGLIHHWNRSYSLSSIRLNLANGAFVGAALAGLATGLDALAPARAPVWADYSPAGWYLPLLGASLGPVLSYFTQCTAILLVIASISILTDRWRKRKWLVSISIALLGLVVVGSAGIDTILAWLLMGALIGLVFLLAFRFVFCHQLSLVLPAIATMLILELIKEATFRAYPAALTGMLLAMILVSGIAYYWFKQLASAER